MLPHAFLLFSSVTYSSILPSRTLSYFWHFRLWTFLTLLWIVVEVHLSYRFCKKIINDSGPFPPLPQTLPLHHPRCLHLKEFLWMMLILFHRIHLCLKHRILLVRESFRLPDICQIAASQKLMLREDDYHYQILLKVMNFSFWFFSLFSRFPPTTSSVCQLFFGWQCLIQKMRVIAGESLKFKYHTKSMVLHDFPFHFLALPQIPSLWGAIQQMNAPAPPLFFEINYEHQKEDNTPREKFLGVHIY